LKNNMTISSYLKTDSSNKTEEIKLGDKVFVTTLLGVKHLGTVRFHGQTKFASGLWYGVELDKPEGRNGGSVQGVRYFTCPEKRGLFATGSKVQKVQAEAAPVRAAPTLSRRSSLNLPSKSKTPSSTIRRSLSTQHRATDMPSQYSSLTNPQVNKSATNKYVYLYT